MTITFRAASAEDYQAFRANAEDAYYEQMVGFGGFTVERARAKAAADLASLLPESGLAPGHRLTIASLDGEDVGSLWIGPGAPSSSMPWVYDVRVVPEHRGSGIGRELMLEAERQAHEAGSDRIGLNVFGRNEVAIRLYESLGYTVASQQMTKPVHAADDAADDASEAAGTADA